MSGLYYTRARFALLFLLIAVLLALRKPDVFTNPQLFAEDASIFFRQQMIAPRIAVFLPYNGQFHLVPRLIALAESVFPLPAAALLCSTASILISAFCYSVFFLPWNRWLVENDLLRAAACLVLATTLDGAEMIGFSGPLMWFLFLVGVLLLFRPEKEAPQGALRQACAGAAMAVIGLSAAPLLMLAPIAGWLAVKRRGVQRMVALALLTTLILQALALVYSKRTDHPARPDPGHPVLLAWQVAAGTIISLSYAGVVTPLAGKDASTNLSKYPSEGPPLLVVIGLVALSAWLCAVSPPRDRRRLALGLYLAFGTVASAIYTRDLVGIAPTLNANAFAMPARYMVVPGALLIYMACLIVQRAPLPDARLQAACLALVFAAGIYGNFRQPPYPDFAWKAIAPKVEMWRAARAGGKPQPGQLVIPIAPPPWIMVLP